MNILLATFGWALILWTLLDAFEQVILPRTESHVFRISSLALRCTWGPWKAIARRISSAERRAAFLGFYGPLSVLILLASWDLSLILGFSLGWWATREGSFTTRFYVSGSNFFALGLSHLPVTRHCQADDANGGWARSGFLGSHHRISAGLLWRLLHP